MLDFACLLFPHSKFSFFKTKFNSTSISALKSLVQVLIADALLKDQLDRMMEMFASTEPNVSWAAYTVV